MDDGLPSSILHPKLVNLPLYRETAGPVSSQMALRVDGNLDAPHLLSILGDGEAVILRTVNVAQALEYEPQLCAESSLLLSIGVDKTHLQGFEKNKRKSVNNFK